MRFTSDATASPRGLEWARARFSALADSVVAPDRRFELVGLMTLLLLLLYSEPIWYLEVGVYGLAVAAIFYRPLLRQPAVWFLITLFLTAGHLRAWFYLDNHKFLLTYWCFAVALALLSPTPTQVLRASARYLLGLAFLFAVIWKVLSPDYLDGSFFEALLLSDERFFEVASFFGGIPSGDIQFSELARRDLIAFGDPRASLPFSVTPRLAALAQVLTWWTILIEAAVAFLFFCPPAWRLSQWRDPALLIFIATTYPVAPVIGFAWLLATMGVAQSSGSRSSLWVLLYTAAYLLVMVISYVPLSRLF